MDVQKYTYSVAYKFHIVCEKEKKARETIFERQASANPPVFLCFVLQSFLLGDKCGLLING